MTCWAVAVTRPNLEMRVGASLTELGYEHRIFKVKSTRIYRGHQVERLVPAFPRYVFVWMLNHYWSTLLSIKGMVDYVRCGQDYAQVENRVVNDLIARSDNESVLQFEPVFVEGFKHGDPVRICGTGSASGHSGTFQFPVSIDRACVLMDWLGRMVHVEVDMRDLEKVVVEPVARKQYRKRRQHRRAA